MANFHQLHHRHPHTEVLDNLGSLEIEALSTCEQGTIVIESDGREVRVR